MKGVTYAEQVWGEPIAGERLSTNGHYTGEHLGSVIQDVQNSNYEYLVEGATIRNGTITQDAIEGSTPEEK